MATAENNAPATPKQVTGKPTNGKMGKKMVAVCSAAIGAIYAAGYMVTLPGAAQASAVPNSNTVAAAPQGPGRRHGRGHGGEDGGYGHGDDDRMGGGQYGQSAPYGGNQGATAPAPGTASVPGAGTTAKSGTYKDGTFTGSGTNRFGTVTVAVTIKGGKISNVQITGYNMHYPQSYISRLPSQVLARQSAQVDFVTGATRSSEDFQTAVQQALQQAMG